LVRDFEHFDFLHLEFLPPHGKCAIAILSAQPDAVGVTSNISISFTWNSYHLSVFALHFSWTENSSPVSINKRLCEFVELTIMDVCIELSGDGRTVSAGFQSGRLAQLLMFAYSQQAVFNQLRRWTQRGLEWKSSSSGSHVQVLSSEPIATVPRQNMKIEI
jgi:hypothetical protein